MPNAQDFNLDFRPASYFGPSTLEQQKLVSLSQLDFDAVDPLNYAAYLRDEPLDGTDKNRPLLMQIGIADTSVPNLASQLHARALGAKHLQPSPRPLSPRQLFALALPAEAPAAKSDRRKSP